MELVPSVKVFVTVVDPNGSLALRRFDWTGDDHEEAVRKTCAWFRPTDIREILTFSETPRRWKVDACATEIGAADPTEQT